MPLTATERSALLQKDLPAPLSEALVRAGVDPTGIWLCSDSDLNLSGGYERVFLAVTPEELLSPAPSDAANPEIIRRRLSRGEITEIRTRQGVGGGFLEAVVEGVFIEVAAYSNARADVFHKIAGKLRHWLKGEPARRGTGRRRGPPQVPQVRHDPPIQGRRLPPVRRPRRGPAPRAQTR